MQIRLDTAKQVGLIFLNEVGHKRKRKSLSALEHRDGDIQGATVRDTSCIDAAAVLG